MTERSCLNDTTAVKIGLRCFFGSFLFLFLAFLFPFSPLKTSHDGALRSICSNQLKVFYSSALEPIPHEYKSQLESPPRHRIAVEAAAAAIKASWRWGRGGGDPRPGGGDGGWPRQRCFPDFKPSLSVEKKIQNFFSSFSSQKQKKEPNLRRAGSSEFLTSSVKTGLTSFFNKSG